MRIGVTERGDAGLDLSWQEKLGEVDAAILITKNLTPGFRKAAMRIWEEDYPFIVHAGCTGWGGTFMEPNVPEYRKQIKNIQKMLAAGIPRERLVLRIDPIIPTEEGLIRAKEVVEYAVKVGILPGMRIRISVYDEYPHCKERLKASGHEPIYGPDGFYAPEPMMNAVRETLIGICDRVPDLTIETCAEPLLSAPCIEHVGCVSTKDLEILGLPIPENAGVNPQNRHGCLCLKGKTELLNHRGQCPHKCVYCYWK